MEYVWKWARTESHACRTRAQTKIRWCVLLSISGRSELRLSSQKEWFWELERGAMNVKKRCCIALPRWYGRGASCREKIIGRRALFRDRIDSLFSTTKTKS